MKYFKIIYLNNIKIQNRDEHELDVNNYDVDKCFEFQAKFPGCS